MDHLSSALITKIKEHPLKTILKNDTKISQSQHSKILLRVPITPGLPEKFDGREVWKGFLSGIKNQGKCGSCWAWASTSCLADRIRLASKNKINPDLSPLRPLLCDLKGKEWEAKYPDLIDYTSKLSNIFSSGIGKEGCHGNSLSDVWTYLTLIGTNTENCMSYTRKDSSQFDIIDYDDDSELPLCTEISGPEGDMCGDYLREVHTGSESGTPARFYRSLSYYSIPGTPAQNGSQENIMTEIFHNGPVTTGMEVYADFYTFDPKTSIYEGDPSSTRISGHAIKIVGWGVELKTPFWWIANSWGKDWGIDGYFKMIRGINNCKIEENVVAGVPDLFYPLGTVFPERIEKTRQALSDDVKQKRLTLDFGNNINGGGMDPRTGYTRRCLYRYTGFAHFNPLLDLTTTLYFLNNKVTYGDMVPRESERKTSGKNAKNDPVWLFLFLFCIFSFGGLVLLSFGALDTR